MRFSYKTGKSESLVDEERDRVIYLTPKMVAIVFEDNAYENFQDKDVTGRSTFFADALYWFINSHDPYINKMRLTMQQKFAENLLLVLEANKDNLGLEGYQEKREELDGFLDQIRRGEFGEIL
jgi:hypothetical protein